jgi:hypothetical protein
LSEDGKTLRIYSVNSTAEARELKFHLVDFPSSVKRGVAYVLEDRDEAGTPEVMNSRDDATRVMVATSPVSAGGKDVAYVFPPYTVTLLEFDLGK